MLNAVIDLTKVVLRLQPVTFVTLTCLTGRLSNQSGRSRPPKPRGAVSKFGQAQQIRTAPPQARQVTMSMSNALFKRCAQRHGDPAFARRLLWPVCACFGFAALPPFRRRDPRAVFTVGGEHTVKRVRLTLGLGTKAASLAMNSTGSDNLATTVWTV